jgi:hypothetical protein
MIAKHTCLIPLLLACLYFMPLPGLAQADSAVFEQGRLRIWCETTRFVYEDNQADSLLAGLNCQSWESLRAAMTRTDANLGVLRLMNSVDKPAIYQGYTTTDARLHKLVSEITTRLKQSPVRRSNTARLGKVDSLQQQLLLLALQLGPEQEGGSSPLASQSRLEQEDSNEAIYPPSDTADTAATGGPLPWNEILQWLLLLALAGLVIWRMREYEERHSRIKREFRVLEKQVNEFMIANLNSAGAPPARKSLTESEIRKLVREELKLAAPERSGSGPTPALRNSATPTPTPQVPFPAPQPQPAANTAPTDAAGPAPAPNPPAPMEEHLPAKEANGKLFYDKMPFRGGFHQHELSRERQRDSLYSISIRPEQEGEAEYWVTEDVEIQRYAMQNGISFFEEGCEFAEVEENPSRVVNEQKGTLRREGSVWKIIQKARVRFE